MKRHIGNLFIIACVLLTVAVWFVFPPVNDGRENFTRAYAGEIIGSVNIVLMAFSLFISARPQMGGAVLRRAGQNVRHPSSHLHRAPCC
ncbi:MAG: hypothetical protein MZV64_00260 [Ignavibacteriales bacterium]|nr:hypothetical protein [Ignavibacteriales bacterium]